jgi:hypothetical protein
LHVELLVTHAFLIPNFLREVLPFRGFSLPGNKEIGRIKVYLPSTYNNTRLFWRAADGAILRFAYPFGITQV